ncbi:MAG: GDSL-type esterase/lipase family protein [Cohaesibacter sp.]|nr:GDSL-type esterase/lipase family protein [Cohaesibacter sp.]
MRRICFVGASTTEGMGDESGLGWPGRLWRLHQDAPTAFVAYNLGVRGQTMHQIKNRAIDECKARLPKAMGPLIILGTGANDLSRFADGDYQGKPRTPRRGLERTFRALLSELSDIAPVLVIGPPPIDEDQMPYRMANGLKFDFRTIDCAEGTELYASICKEMEIPFFDLFGAMLGDADYQAALKAGDGLHPTGRGYQACALALNQWGAWRKALSEGWA